MTFLKKLAPTLMSLSALTLLFFETTLAASKYARSIEIAAVVLSCVLVALVIRDSIRLVRLLAHANDPEPPETRWTYDGKQLVEMPCSPDKFHDQPVRFITDEQIRWWMDSVPGKQVPSDQRTASAETTR